MIDDILSDVGVGGTAGGGDHSSSSVIVIDVGLEVGDSCVVHYNDFTQIMGNNQIWGSH